MGEQGREAERQVNLLVNSFRARALLGHYETRLAADFDRIEPLALELVARTERSLVDLISTRHALRVEWYIVALIVLEILLSLYALLA